MYKNKKKVNPHDLAFWLQTNLSENVLIFDKCSDLFSIIIQRLKEEKIHLAVDNNVLMIKLCKYFYENSYHF
tara:strand:+ start:546 stop:761 length:216 start_codon:yes stop_codon:yes gene_type:complete